jgi:uncharacterized protein (TIGR02118 family)
MNKGSIKVSVIYPDEEGKTFDMDYYCNKHIPMVAGLLGDAIIGATVEKGIGGADPDTSAPFQAMGNIYFESVESFQNSFGPHAAQIMGDVTNYTNIEPQIQVSEVMI